MFCSTVSRDSALVSWNVRTTPSRATWCGGELAQRPAVERPRASVGLVEAGQQVEQRRLARAVGPDQAGDAAALDLQVVDRHGGETAEVRVTPSTTTAASGFATPISHGRSRSAGCARRRGRRRCGRRRARGRSPGPAPGASHRRRTRSTGRARGGVGSAGIEQHLSSITEDPLRPEDHQEHDAEADDDEAGIGDVGLEI